MEERSLVTRNLRVLLAVILIALGTLFAMTRLGIIGRDPASCTMHYDQAMMIVSPQREMGASLRSVFIRQWVSGAWYDQRTEATDPTTGYLFAGPFTNAAQANAWSVLNDFGKDGATICVGRYTGASH